MERSASRNPPAIAGSAREKRRPLLSNRPRDSQRRKVYNSEQAHSLWTWDAHQYESIQEVQEWVTKICNTRWFKNRFPNYAVIADSMFHKEGIKVLDGRGRRRPCGSTRGFIKLPKWSRSDLVILHEISHVVTRRKNRHLPLTAFHGREFCANYLALVRRFLGKDAGDELKASFKKHKAKYTRKKGG